MTDHNPARTVRELPDWPNGFEPEKPRVRILDHGLDATEISLRLNDKVTAEWLAYWLTSGPSWNAFQEWLDNRR